MKSAPIMAITLAACLLAACAHYPDGDFAMQDGWRVAHVDALVTLADSPPTVAPANDCRRAVGDSVRLGGSWVLVHYRRPPGQVFRIAPVDATDAWAPGQEVYVNVTDCHARLVARQSSNGMGHS